MAEEPEVRSHLKELVDRRVSLELLHKGIHLTHCKIAPSGSQAAASRPGRLFASEISDIEGENWLA